MLRTRYARPTMFRGKVVVVTGASAGVGRAVALRFARDGAVLALLAREPAALDETKREIVGLGGRAAVFPVDVADSEAVLAAAEAIRGVLGPIDIWINNAMVTVFSTVADMTPAEFRRVTEVTYLGVVHGTMAALRHMRPRNAGTIVQIGSMLAYRGIPLQSAYCGAKHAIRGFTESLRTELLHERSRIRVTIVELPAVNTPQFDWARTHRARQPRPMGRVFQPEAVAEQIARAAAWPVREYWLGPATVVGIIANMLAPGLLGRYLALVGFAEQDRAAPVSAARRDNLDAPVVGRHRSRGSFGDNARNRVAALAGPVARAGAALALVGVAGYAVAVLTGSFEHPRLRRDCGRRQSRS